MARNATAMPVGKELLPDRALLAVTRDSHANCANRLRMKVGGCMRLAPAFCPHRGQAL